MMKILRSWWAPVILVVVAAVTAVALCLSLTRVDVAIRFQMVMFIMTGLGILLFGWWVLLSPVGWPWRLGALLGLAAIAGTFFLLVRLDRLDGDIFPRFAWRWTPGADRVPDDTARQVLLTAALPLVDCPGFLGAAHDGVIRGVTLDPDWSSHPPQVCWRRGVGAAWSGFAVAGGDTVTMEQYGDEEVVGCYALADGAVRWRHRYAARYASKLGGIGPRATPALDADAVFALGATGELRCLDRRDGALRWRHNLLAEEGGVAPIWAVAASPLLIDDLVVVLAGGSAGRSVIAYDRRDGTCRWAAGDDAAGYASPMALRFNGRDLVAVFTLRSLVVHDARTGAVVERAPWPGKGPTAAQPLFVPPDRLLASSAYGNTTTCFALRADDGAIMAPVWSSQALMSKISNAVYHRGQVYGLSDGTLVCIDAGNGKQIWRGGRPGHGQIFLVGDHLLVSGEKDGAVLLVAADPSAYRVLGRFDIFADEAMTNPPCFAPPYLVVRTTREAVCVQVPLR